MADTKVEETKNEARLRELNEKADFPQREGALRSALTDLVEKEKAAKVRVEEDKVAIDTAQKVVDEAEKALKGEPEVVEEPVVPKEKEEKKEKEEFK